MSHLGDFALGKTFDTKFTTVTTTGAPTTLAGSPVVSAYVDNNTTQLTAGITLSVDFDGVTGLHNIRVVATSGNGYAAGGNYQLVITTGTVGGTSVVGYVVAEFSIEARSSLRPTTADRALDVSAGGEAGMDWANIGSPTTAQNLSATNIDVDQVVASVSGAVGSVTGAVGSVAGAVGSVTGNVGGNVVGSVASVTAGVTLAASAIQAIWDAATSALATAGSIGKLLVDNINATISSRASQASLDTVDDFLDTEVAAIKAKTDNLPTDPADASDVASSFSTVNGTLATIAGYIDTEIATILSAVDSEVSAIKAKTDALPASPAATGDIPTAAAIADANWDELRAGHSVAGSYGESFFTLESGAAIAGTLSTTQMSTNLTEADNDHYIGRIIVWLSGALLRQATDITDYDGTTKVLTFTATTEAPAAADKFIIV